MRVAVLGAGFQGVCVALEIARRGVAVDLYDENDACITQAGYRNEGKIHLGFVYANDPTFETAQLMAQGAMMFGRALHRWLERDISAIGVSSPFDYVVHRGSLTPTDQVLAHFARVTTFVRDLATATGQTYLGEDVRTVAVRSLLAEFDDTYDPDVVAAVVETNERAINVRLLAELLRKRIADDNRVAFMARRRVTTVVRAPGGFEVRCADDGSPVGNRYRQIVNCLWDGRLLVDQTMGVHPRHRWLHRLKYGINMCLRHADNSIPSTTIVLGPYGDIVRQGDRHMYITWYPTCLGGLSGEIAPPEWPRDLAGEGARHVIEGTLAGLARIVVPLREFQYDDIESAIVAGGIITAAGETDIDDPGSRLHTRTAVGVRSADGYHSVDTGKYTLAPMYAIEITDRVCGVR